ncbi:MAG: TRAP transporter small permease subunit [Croceibacterium sp.]
MNLLARLGIWTGGTALLAATAIDTVAVIGRNVGLPVIGSIELVQAAVLLSGVFALIFSTAGDDHARVRIVTDRIRRGRAVMAIIGPMSMALFFACLLAGSVWLAADLWNGHERSELLGVSWRLLRLVANLGLAACIIVSLAPLFRQKRP